MVKNGESDLQRARHTGLSARRARRTKSRGPEGLHLEVGARRAPRLLVYYIFRKQGLKGISNISLKTTMKDLGMRKMFTNQADLGRLSRFPTPSRNHSLLCENLRREFCSSKGGFCQILEPTWFRRKERSKTAGPRKCWRVRFVRVCCVQSQLDSNDPNRLPSKDSYNRLSTGFFIDLSMKTIHPPKVPKTLRSKHIQLMM